MDIVKKIIQEAYEPVKEKLSRMPGALKEGLDKIARHIQMGNIYVALVGDNVVGTMRLELRGQKGVISRLAVKKAFRARRIGTTLMDYAESHLGNRNATCIEVEVYGAIEEQLSFYERLGYKEAGRSTREGEEIVLMRKSMIKEDKIPDDF